MPLHSLALMCSAILALIHGPASAPARPAGEENPIHWKGDLCTSLRIAKECGDAPVRAISSWADWADSHGYELFLNEDGRVLLLLKNKPGSTELDLVKRTCRFVDELLKPALTAASGEAPAPVTGVPEESDPPAARLPAPVDETAVLVQAKDMEDYQTVLEHAAEMEPYLQSWVETGRKLAGCTLVRPLCSSWIELLDGQEEWDIKNELVHRLATLLVVRRFGEQPFWLTMGLSWYVESEVRGAIYCFPYRDEFVWATEHGSWDTDVKRIFKEAGTGFLGELVAWKRGSYDATAAREAWALARFMATDHSGAIPAILADLHALREEKGVTHTGRTWEVIVGWEPSLEDQRAVLERHLGNDFVEEILEQYAKGKKSKAGK